MDGHLRRLAPLMLAALFAARSAAQFEADERFLPTDTVPAIAFVDGTADADLAGVATGGNGHTGGLAWPDADADGWPDLFVANGAGLPHRLFRNDRDGTFTDASALVPKPNPAVPSAAVVFADLDNDGDTEILVAVDSATPVDPVGANPEVGGPNLLYRNDGGGVFTEVAAAWGFLDPLGRRTGAIALADADGDGLVDVYASRWQFNDAELDDDDRMLRNLGGAAFEDVTGAWRLGSYGRDGIAARWFDVDRDGTADLYVGNAGPSEPLFFDCNDVLYENELDEVGSFCDLFGDPRAAGDDAPWARAVDVADVEDDGDWDVYVTDAATGGAPPVGNALYLGNPDGTLSDNVADVAGVAAPMGAWPCQFADFDVDGRVDLFVGAAAAADRHRVYRNLGDVTFADVVIDGMTGDEARSSALADFDRDGDVDVAVFGDGTGLRLWRNESVAPVGERHRLEVRLVGTLDNRDAIGATVLATANGRTRMRAVSGGDGSHAQSEQTLHFGLGHATVADLVVEWPLGADESFPGVAADALVTIVQGVGIVSIEDLR